MRPPVPVQELGKLTFLTTMSSLSRPSLASRRWHFLLPTLLALFAGCDGTDPSPEPIPPAQWTRVEALPVTFMDALYADGDTLFVGAGSTLYASRDGGRTWTASTPVPDGYEIAAITRQANRLFVGTFGGGIYEGLDGGRRWVARNTGLTGNATRTVLAFTARGNRLYAGTDGASVFALDLTQENPAWQPFHTGVPSQYAWNTSSLLERNGSLVLGAGGNGHVYLNAGESDPWHEVQYTVPAGEAVMMYEMIPVGSDLIGGSTLGFHRSTDGGQTWETFNPHIGLIEQVDFARHGERVFATATSTSRGTRLYERDATGAWLLVEHLPGVLTLDCAVYRDRLYTTRHDGLWYFPLTAEDR